MGFHTGGRHLRIGEVDRAVRRPYSIPIPSVERKGDHKDQATSWSPRCGREATYVCAGNSDTNSPPGRMVAGAICVFGGLAARPMVNMRMASGKWSARPSPPRPNPRATPDAQVHAACPSGSAMLPASSKFPRWQFRLCRRRQQARPFPFAAPKG